MMVKNKTVDTVTSNDISNINLSSMLSLQKMYIPETILQNKFTSLTITEDENLVAISQNGGAIIYDAKIVNFVPYNKKNKYVDWLVTVHFIHAALLDVRHRTHAADGLRLRTCRPIRG